MTHIGYSDSNQKSLFLHALSLGIEKTVRMLIAETILMKKGIVCAAEPFDLTTVTAEEVLEVIDSCPMKLEDNPSKEDVAFVEKMQKNKLTSVSHIFHAFEHFGQSDKAEKIKTRMFQIFAAKRKALEEERALKQAQLERDGRLLTEFDALAAKLRSTMKEALTESNEVLARMGMKAGTYW